MNSAISKAIKIAIFIFFIFLITLFAGFLFKNAKSKEEKKHNKNIASINLSTAIERIKSYEKPSHIISDKFFSFCQIDEQDMPNLIEAYVFYDENWKEIKLKDKSKIEIEKPEIKGLKYIVKIKIQSASKDFESKKNEEITINKSYLSSKELIVSKNFYIDGEVKDISQKQVESLIRLKTGKHYVYESFNI